MRHFPRTPDWRLRDRNVCRGGRTVWNVIPHDRKTPCGTIVKKDDGWSGAFHVKGGEWRPIPGPNLYGLRREAAQAVFDQWDKCRPLRRQDYEDLRSRAGLSGNPLVLYGMPAECHWFDRPMGEMHGQTADWWTRIVESVGLDPCMLLFERNPGLSSLRMDVYVPDRLIVEQKASWVSLDADDHHGYGGALPQVDCYRKELEHHGDQVDWCMTCNYREARAYRIDPEAGLLAERERWRLTDTWQAFDFRVFLRRILTDEDEAEARLETMLMEYGPEDRDRVREYLNGRKGDNR